MATAAVHAVSSAGYMLKAQSSTMTALFKKASDATSETDPWLLTFVVQYGSQLEICILSDVVRAGDSRDGQLCLLDQCIWLLY